MPPTTSCPHCGAPLEPLTVVVNGREVRVATRPCPCPGAAAERAELERREADEERARLVRQAARRVERAGIPRRYLDAEHPKAQAVSAKVLAGRGAYLHGGNGTGKTHLACAAALLCLMRGMDVRFAVVPSLLEGIRSRSKGAGETVSSLSSCGLLVLDDLGKEAACTPYAAERLFDIVNERYNSMLPVVVTSNFTRGEVARRISEGEVGVAIASRLAEMTDSVRLDGADRRIHG